MAAENNIVGEVGLLVKPIDPNAQFNRGVDEIIRKLEKQAQFQVKASGLEDVQHQANAAGQAFANAAVQAAGLTAAVYGIKAGIEGAIGKFSKLFDQLAQARAGFSTILKSEAAGGALLADIREFARVSPFVTQELVNYSQQLLGVGLSAQKIVPLLEDVGNIVSSVGGDTQNIGRVLFTLTQIQSIGRLAGQDAMQLQSALIPITKYLSDYLNKTTAEVKKLQEQGLISAETVFAAISAQGDKVQGAMAKATRNIAGARAVLSDTVTIMLQNQPVLNKIFDDVYKGIANFANAIGEPEFQLAFERFFDGVDKVYEGLQPLFESLSEIAGSTAITGLGLFATAFDILGTALNAIPADVLTAVVRIFIALSTIKAPLLLIQYITSIQRMAVAIAPAITNMSKLTSTTIANSAALRANTVELTANQQAMLKQAWASNSAGVAAKTSRFGRAMPLAGLAGVIGGQMLSERSPVGGGALTGAGLGASFGGVPGAVIGAAIGGGLAWMNQVEEKAKKHILEMKRLGTEAGEAFVKSETDKFKDGSPELFAALETQIAVVEAQIKKIEDVKKAQLGDRGGGSNQFVGRANLGEILDKSLAPQLGKSEAELQVLKDSMISGFEQMQQGAAELVLGIDKGTAAYFRFTQGSGVGGGGVPLKDMKLLSEAAKHYGFELEDLKDPAKIDGLLLIIKTFDGITTAQQNATKAAQDYNKVLEEANKAADLIYGPQEKRLQKEISDKKTIASAEQAQYNQSTVNSKLAADAARIEAMKVVHALAYVDAVKLGGIEMEKAIKIASAAAQKAAEDEEKRLLGLYGASGKDRGGTRKDVAAPSLVPQDFKFILDSQIQDREQAEAAAILAKEAAEKAAKEAEDAAEKARDDAIAFAEKVKSSTTTLTERLQSAANEIAAAADRWVGSIKERTQYEQAVSTTRLTKNTQKQIDDVTEMTAGLASLKARGVTDDVLKALGVDNIADLKQVRKLLRSSDTDLSALSAAVTERDKKAIDLATSEEDTRTRKNIEEGILAAATTLGMDMTKAEATGIANQFTFNTTSNADEIAAQILSILSGGAITR